MKRGPAGEHGFPRAFNKSCAIDDDWQALRFVHRRV